MYREAIKKNIASIAAIIVSIAFAGCNQSGNNQATALLDQAKEALNNGDFERVILLTDSLKSAYPKEIDLRRDALHLSVRATEGLTLQQLQRADSIAATLGARGDSLSHLIKFVKNPIEGYYVASTADPSNFIGSDGIQARVSPEGDFYLVSSLRSKKVNSTSVTVTDGHTSATTATVDFDGERNDRSMGAEVITFISAESDSVGKYLLKNRDLPLTLVFNGSSSYSMPLKKSQIDELALVYDYASTIRNFRIASLEKERLTKALDIARSQAARTFVEKDSVNK